MLSDALTLITSIVSQLTTVIVMLGESPGEVSINYMLHTPQLTTEFTAINETEYKFKPGSEVKIFCHDWQNLVDIAWYDYMTEEYKKRGEYNIITADYASVFKNASIQDSFLYIKPLGEALGDYIIQLRELGVPFEKIHVLGHRLGAHVAGVAGERVYAMTGETIDRITGLDPSDVGVFEVIRDGRLSRDDATFVDIVQASYPSAWFDLGRVDFHPSSITYLCDYSFYNNLTDAAPKLYSITIAPKNSKMFRFERCGKYDENYNCVKNISAYMGEYTNRKAYGSFYLDERNEVPICKILNIPLAPIVTYEQ